MFPDHIVLIFITQVRNIMISIQFADSQHIPDIQAVAAATWPVTFQHILSPEQIHYMLDMMYSTASLTAQMNQQHHQFLLAQEQGDTLGFISFENAYKQQATTKVHKIYILPQAQRRGIGQQLLEAVATRAIHNGSSNLTLHVNRDNKAITFYQKIGFDITGREDIDIGYGYLMEDYIMEKEISKQHIWKAEENL